MREEIVTTDLSRFGYRELSLAGKLLEKYGDDGAPDDFDTDGLTLYFNANSGYVFLSNSNADVLMMNGEKLEEWHSLPYSGHEGFFTDLLTDYKNGNITNDEDIQALRELAKAKGKRLPRRKS